MTLNTIQLPGFLYTALYKKSLVDLRGDKISEDLTSEIKIDFLGGNGKRIVFVANDTKNKFLADEQMIFLNDLLIACHLTMADIAFVNLYQNSSMTYQDLISKLDAQKILVFGITTQNLDLPFAIPFFQVQAYHEQVFMVGPSLEEIQGNVQSKKQLWNCLQKIFNIQKRK